MPKGYEWVWIYSNTPLAEIDEMCQGTVFQLPAYNIVLVNPKAKLFGIRSCASKKLVFLVWGIPTCVNIRGKSLTFVQIHSALLQNDNEDYLNLLYNIAVKELMRWFKLNLIYQGMFILLTLPTISTDIIKPVVTQQSYYLDLTKLALPYSTPQTTGLRKMTSKDIPSALALTNKYTSQFEIGQLFQNEEEFTLKTN